jgi:hypothetical protein
MRRILKSVVVLVLIMAAMILATMAMPALAAPPGGTGAPAHPGESPPLPANDTMFAVLCEQDGEIAAGFAEWPQGGGAGFAN